MYDCCHWISIGNHHSFVDITRSTTSQYQWQRYRSLGHSTTNVWNKIKRSTSCLAEFFQYRWVRNHINQLRYSFRNVYFNRHLISRYQVGSPIKMKTKTLPLAQEFGRKINFDSIISLTFSFLSRWIFTQTCHPKKRTQMGRWFRITFEIPRTSRKSFSITHTQFFILFFCSGRTHRWLQIVYLSSSGHQCSCFRFRSISSHHETGQYSRICHRILRTLQLSNSRSISLSFCRRENSRA